MRSIESSNVHRVVLAHEPTHKSSACSHSFFVCCLNFISLVLAEKKFPLIARVNEINCFLPRKSSLVIKTTENVGKSDYGSENVKIKQKNQHRSPIRAEAVKSAIV